MCCSTIFRISSRIRSRSCSSGTAACRFTAASPAASSPSSCSPAARHPDAVARRRHLRGRRRSGCSSAASPISSTANCGAGRPTCRGPWSFPTAARSRAIPASSTRRRSKASCCSSCSALLVRFGALKRPGAHHRRVLALGYGVARIICELFREPDVQLGFLWGGLTMGMLLCIPLMLGGHRLSSLSRSTREPMPTQMADDRSPLESEIRRLIAVAGPMPVAEYMRLCLTHPQHGYYITRDPIGAAGDFITAPEISQMFGELIGLWVAAVWQQMGAPENVRLVELGPGRGTLMLDALAGGQEWSQGFRTADRAASRRDQPGAASSAAAAARTTSTCRSCGTPRSKTCPAGPCIIIANEFIDALPVHQAVKQRTAGTSASSRSAPTAICAIGVAREPLPHFDATLPRELRAGARRRDLRMALRHHRARARPARARRRRRADHRLRPCAATAWAKLCRPSPDMPSPIRCARRAKPTSPRMSISRRWRRARKASARRIHGPISQRDFLLPARHRQARGGAQGQRAARARPPRSTSRWRG